MNVTISSDKLKLLTAGRICSENVIVINSRKSEESIYAEICDETFGTTYTVTFNSNGGTEIDDEEVYTGQTATEPTAPTKSGCEFCGWYSDSGLESAYIFTSAVTSDITLYAKWTASAA